MKLKTRGFFLAIFLFGYYGANAQDLTNNFKTWGSVGLSYKIHSKLYVKMSQLVAFNISSPGFSFSQTNLSLSYKIKSGTYLEGGFAKGLFSHSNSLERQGGSPSINNTLAVDRVFVKASYKQAIVKRLSVKHRVEFQYFFTDLDKYKTRALYSARFAYNVRRSSLLPYVEGKIYHYQGGQELDNGFKRFRLKTGVSFKPVKDFAMRVSLYHFMQSEFNTTPLSENNYMALGAAVSFRL